jgi:1-aminocyclopropane-1-carboxylate deaminase
MVQFKLKKKEVPIQKLEEINGVALFIKRDDLLHPEVSGNKWYKLKYHVDDAIQKGMQSVVTFGGAYSNHLAATAAYCDAHGLKATAYVRGEIDTTNITMQTCIKYGMELIPLSRGAYREKDNQHFLDSLHLIHPQAFIIPEGGGGSLGIKGASEILDDRCAEYDLIACAVGTGTTAMGMLQGSEKHQSILAIPVHKHIKIFEEKLFADRLKDNGLSSRLLIDGTGHFGGYAKWNETLLGFINQFYNRYQIKLDPIYTGKAMYTLLQWLREGRIEKGQKVLFIHTGGIQGALGFERRYNRKLYGSYLEK